MANRVGVVPHPRYVGHVAADPLDLLMDRAVGVVVGAHEDVLRWLSELGRPFAPDQVEVAAYATSGDDRLVGADLMAVLEFAADHRVALGQDLSDARFETYVEAVPRSVVLDGIP